MLGCPTSPDFLSMLMALANFMRLSSIESRTRGRCLGPRTGNPGISLVFLKGTAFRPYITAAKMAMDARPGGPTAKRQPSPEGLGNRFRRGSERRRRGTQPIVRSPCVIRNVLGKFARLRSLCSILPVPTWCVRCDVTPPRADRYTLDLCVATRAPR